MKRSELIELIESTLYDMNVDSNGATEMVGETILNLLESKGMAPPEVKEPVETLYQDANGKVVRGEDSTLFVRKWEDET